MYPSDDHSFLPPPSKPIAVKNGVVLLPKPKLRELHKLRWWGERWGAPLLALTHADRRKAGENYARCGQVFSFKTEPGVVSAKVQGTRREAYLVSFKSPALTQLDWLSIAKELALDDVDANINALHEGFLPDRFVAVVARAGHHFFTSHIEAKCDCDDWQPMCRHIAAATLVAQQEFAQDPFLLLRFRGIERAVLLALIRSAEAENEPHDATPHDTQPSAAEPPETPKLAVDLSPAIIDAPLMHQLLAPPGWREDASFVRVMERLSARAARDARVLDLALGAPQKPLD